MKKIILLLPVLGLMLACGGRPGQTEAEALEEAEAIEQTTQKLDEVIETSEQEIEDLQSEIDELLNDD